MLILDFFQFKANYPRRIMLSMGVNIVVFTLLAISTQSFTGVSATAYLVFILLMVFITSVATALCQNGAFAFVATFHTPAYISAIMVGQAIAGVLPSVAGIASVLATTPAEISANMEQKLSIENKANTKSALIYFLTATAISAFGLVMFVPLVRKHNKMLKEGMISSTTSLPERTKTSMWKLYRKLYWQASAVAMCFTVTMFFPVFTSKVFSLVPEDKASPIYRPSAFIPLGFLVWNLGDLLGRVSTSIPMFRFRKHPRTLLVLAVARSGFIPLYLLCNIGGKGAVVQSDFFYLFVVQLLYGATSGWLSSLCMLSPGDYIEEGELEAAGTFMATNLVAGLAAGSLLSFAVSKFQGIWAQLSMTSFERYFVCYNTTENGVREGVSIGIGGEQGVWDGIARYLGEHFVNMADMVHMGDNLAWLASRRRDGILQELEWSIDFIWSKSQMLFFFDVCFMPCDCYLLYLLSFVIQQPVPCVFVEPFRFVCNALITLVFSLHHGVFLPSVSLSTVSATCECLIPSFLLC